MNETPRYDFTKGEIAAATASSALVLVAAAAALGVASLDRPAAAAEIDHGGEVAVRIVPVVDIDAPLLQLGGKRDQARLPDRWVRPEPSPRVAKRSYVSTRAGKTERDAPPPSEQVADAGAPLSPTEAEVAKQVDRAVIAPVDAGPPASLDRPGTPDGVKEGTEPDPLKARAVDRYRAKIAGWFSSRFAVHGSGIVAEQLVALRGRAVVQIGAGHVVTGYTLAPSGNAAFDAAARAALEGAKGEELPPPPENYPDIEQTQINITFVCRANRCD